MASPNYVLAIAIVLFATILQECGAGSFCSNGEYCTYDCCDGICCQASMALIIGLVVGGAILLFIVIFVICICRRNRFRGIVYRSQPAAGTVVIQQSTAYGPGGMVTTAGTQPGMYPNYPPAYGANPMPYAPAYSGYAAAPPTYDEVTHNQPPAQAGMVNYGYQAKN